MTTIKGIQSQSLEAMFGDARIAVIISCYLCDFASKLLSGNKGGVLPFYPQENALFFFAFFPIRLTFACLQVISPTTFDPKELKGDDTRHTQSQVSIKRNIDIQVLKDGVH